MTVKKKTYADGLKDAFEFINHHGISLVHGGKEPKMFLTFAFGNAQDDMKQSVTFTRKAETGIFFFLTDEQWKQLKEGAFDKEVKGI